MAARFNGPVQWNFRGDAGLCKRLVPKARIAAGWLFNQIDTGPGGVTHRAGRWAVDLGAGIRGEYYVIAMQGPLARTAFVDARVVVPQEIDVLHTEATFDLYHGWVTWDSPTYPGGPRPALVFVDTDLSTYFSGDGTLIPDSDPLRHDHMIGELTVQDLTVPYWLGSPPDLDANNAYPWPFSYPSEPANVNMVFTGEARLMNQALRGSGRTWSDVVGVTEMAVPSGSENGYGVFWSSDGELWLVRPYGGLSGARLTVNENLSSIVDWLVDPDKSALLGAEGRQKARAWVYAYAKVSEDETVYSLLSSAQVGAVVQNGATRFNPVVGFQWTWQPSINSQARGFYNAWRYASSKHYTRISEIEVTFTDGVPSASITIGSEYQWGGSSSMVLRPTGNGVEVQVLPAGTLVSNSEVTVYKFTTTDGGVASVIRRAIVSVSLGNGGSSLNPVVCGLGTESTWYRTYDSHVDCGYRIAFSGGGGHDESGPIYSQYDVNTKTVTIKATGTYTTDGTDDNMAYVGPSTCVDDGHSDGYFYSKQATIYEAAADIIQDWPSLSSGSGHRMLCLLPTDNGVAVGMRQYRGTYRRDYGARLNNKGTSGRMAWKAELYRDDPYNYTVTKVFRAVMGEGSGVVHIANLGLYWNSGYVNFFTNTTYDNGSTVRTLVLAPSTGTMITMDASSWNTLYGTTAYATGAGPKAITSWGGKLIYSPTTTTMAYPSGVSSHVSDMSNVAPIGAV